jgi:RNA recognition motif-containing protein
MPCRLFVAGLTRSITNEELRARFEAFGPVTDVFVPLDADTGDPRGFGFVTMADSKDASRAISKLDGEEIDGRNMVVRIATDRR